ncbi:hypothetical protein J2R98_002363 [Alkalibacillus filiformis]|uniref:MEDS domain-containing protein n=1 Tax=Alkalibacillus filiformis TaxID=200990 RepID=A0ABU0DVN0_9BACI|nr:MEDS domain-containing protein [Alkalibacillus filiformis]MDQ0352518.1 hypothetical protein [Alkalibacillus filiformis]
MNNSIQLTKHVEVPKGAHIFFYECEEDYVNNLLAYAKAGVEHDQHVLIIENPAIYETFKVHAEETFTEEELTKLHFHDNKEFYFYNEGFHIHNIVKKFGEILTPLFDKGLTVRTWANVVWKDEDYIFQEIIDFENQANHSVGEMELVSVCAYPGEKVPANIQTELMKTHEYLMTDTEFVRSSFYYSTT